MKRYHAEIGIPPGIPLPWPGLRLRYSRHAETETLRDGMPLLRNLPADYILIEVELYQNEVTKWVLRLPASGRTRELVLAVRPDGLVKTAWTNATGDNHKTLRREHYDREETC